MLALVLAMMLALSPIAPKTGEAVAFASAIALVASKDTPPDGMSRELGAAYLVVYAWGEGRFSTPKRGDRGRSVCSLQVMVDDPELHRKDLPEERRRELEAKVEARKRQLERDPVACVRAGYAVMRASQRVCGGMSGYCGACRGFVPAAASLAAEALAEKRARAAQGILDSALMAQ